MFVKIRTAYETLSDAELLQSAKEIDSRSLGGKIKEAFGKAAQKFKRAKPPAKKGSDERIEAEISFRQMLDGCVLEADYWRAALCPACAGQRGAGGQAPKRCRGCSGIGHSVGGLFKKSCSRCGGSGLDRASLCCGCGGTGLVRERKRLEIKIPAGNCDGRTMVCPGMGHWGIGADAPGDLKVVLSVKPDSVFSCAGDKDLKRTVWIDAIDAAVGRRIKVEGAYGQQHEAFVRAGCLSGDVVWVEGGGIRTAGGCGDLILEIELSHKARSSEFFEELRRILAEEEKRRAPVKQNKQH